MFTGVIKKVTDPVVVKKSSRSVTLTWNAGTRPDLKLYEIELVSERRGITETVRTEGLSNSFKLEDLHPSTTYKYKIRAVAANENEKGPWSETLEFTTGGKYHLKFSILNIKIVHLLLTFSIKPIPF